MPASRAAACVWIKRPIEFRFQPGISQTTLKAEGRQAADRHGGSIRTSGKLGMVALTCVVPYLAWKRRGEQVARRAQRFSFRRKPA